jgi:hypothetical protein
MPSDAAYDDYASGTWTPGGTATGGWGSASNQLPIPRADTPQAIPKTLLCHASHGRWLEAAGGAEGAWVASFPGADQAAKVGAAGGDRCSKLVYDCVFKLATLINDWKAGTLPSGALDPSVATCLTAGCHGSQYDPLDPENCAPEVAGKMKCNESCHQ